MTNSKKKTETGPKRNVRAATKKVVPQKTIKKTPKKNVTPKKKVQPKKEPVAKKAPPKKVTAKKVKGSPKPKAEPKKRRAKKRSSLNGKMPIKCTFKTKVNFIKISNSLTAATIRPHLMNLETMEHDTRNGQIKDTIRNLRTFRAFNPGERNRWRDILHVEGSTSLIGIRTAPAALKIMLFSAMYLFYENMFAIRGQTESSKPKVVQEEDVETYFSELKPVMFGSETLIPWEDMDGSSKKKNETGEDPDSESSTKKPSEEKNGNKNSKNPDQNKKTKTEKKAEDDTKKQSNKRKLSKTSKPDENDGNDDANSEQETEKKTKRQKRN